MCRSEWLRNGQKLAKEKALSWCPMQSYTCDLPNGDRAGSRNSKLFTQIARKEWMESDYRTPGILRQRKVRSAKENAVEVPALDSSIINRERNRRGSGAGWR